MWRRGRKAEKALQIESENYASTLALMSGNISASILAAGQGRMDVRRQTPAVKETEPDNYFEDNFLCC